MVGEFRSFDDMEDCGDHILNRTHRIALDSGRSSEDRDTAKELKSWARQLIMHAINHEQVDSDEVEEHWKMFEALTANDEGDSSEYWTGWRVHSDQTYEFGHGSTDAFAVLKKYQATPINYYPAKPGPIRWKLHPIDQQVSPGESRRFYLLSAPVVEVDAISAVPSMTEDITVEEAGKRVLDHTRADDEWQRSLDAKRMHLISQFISDSDNVIANAPMLFVKPSDDESKPAPAKVVEDDGEFYLEIGFDFLNCMGRLCTDHYLGKDLRPLWLIDGQHRIRGMRTSERGHLLYVPLILFPEDFGLANAAKVFAEINTLQSPLTALHELFMGHRFEIHSKNPKRDFRKWENIGEEGYSSRANSLAYEIAAYLASEPGSPLYGAIRMLDMKERKTVVKATQWVDFAREWFLNDSDKFPYYPDCGLDRTTMLTEVWNYFSVFRNQICNHEDWPNGGNRWVVSPSGEPMAKGKSIIQQHTTFPVLLWLYKDVISAIIRRKKSLEEEIIRPFTESDFLTALAPLTFVDWLDDDLKTWAGGGGEQGRRSLYAWMENAVLNGVAYDYSDVMSTGIRSQRGKGILSPLSLKPVIRIDENSASYPTPKTVDTKAQSMVIIAERPINSLPTSTWSISDANGNPWNRTETKKVESDLNRPSTSSHDGLARYPVKWDDWLKNTPYIVVKVGWKNRHLPRASSEIRIFPDGRIQDLENDEWVDRSEDDDV